MATLESFLTRLMVWVPSCPRPLADQALRDTAVRFCRDTEIVQTTVTPLDVSAGVSEYVVPLPTGRRISRVLRAQYRGTPLNGVSELPNDGAQAVPDRYTSPTSTSVRLYPAPDETQTSVLFLDLAIEPTRNAETLPDELFDDWVEAIVAGAGAYICSIPDQPFTNPLVAAQLASVYKAKESEAKTEAGRVRVRSNSRVQFNRFA